MIIKSALLFLRVFDLVCDSYEWFSKKFKSDLKQEAFIANKTKEAQPNYSYR